MNFKNKILFFVILFVFIKLNAFSEKNFADLLSQEKKNGIVWVETKEMTNQKPLIQRINSADEAPFNSNWKIDVSTTTLSFCAVANKYVPLQIIPWDDTFTTYKIDWGDGTITSGTYQDIINHFHVYSTYGEYTVVLNFGSYNSQYIAYYGLAPSVKIIGPQLNQYCVGDSVEFKIFGTENNPKGTKYKLVFTNKPDSILEFGENNPLPATFKHKFEKIGSCGFIFRTGDGKSYENAFGVIISAINPCSTNGIPDQAGPYYVSSIPKFNKERDTIKTCVNKIVKINNLDEAKTTPYVDAQGVSTCQSSFKKRWIITPASGWVLNPTQTLGYTTNTTDPDNPTFWDNGSTELDITFTQAGEYKVEALLANQCFTARVPQFVKVDPIISPKITLISKTDICGNIKLKLENTTQINQSNFAATPSYSWSISAPGRFINNTDKNSLKPEFELPQRGVYAITLTYTGTLCDDVSTEVNYTVRGVPTVSINPMDACLSGSSVAVKATATINDFGETITSYKWSIKNSAGSEIFTDTIKEPTFVFDQIGIYTAQLIVNSCGTNTTIKKFEIEPKPTISSVSNFAVYENQAVPTINFNVLNASQGIRWVNSNTAIGLPSNGTSTKGNEQLPSFKALNPGVTPITATITVYPLNIGCQGDPISFTITVLPLLSFRPTFDFIEFNKCGNKTVKFKNLTDTTLLNNLIHTYNFKWSVSPSGFKYINQTNEFSFEPEIEFLRKDTFTIILHILYGTLNIKSEPQTIFNDSLYVYAFISDTKVKCGNSVQLNAQCNYKGEGKLKYKWRPSDFLDNDTIENPVSTPYRDIKYEIEIITPEECIVKNTIFIKIEKSDLVPIHFVGVESGKNIIVWVDEETEYRDSVFIYKETYTSNIYEKIGGVQYGEAFFIDTLSNPSITSNKYKISNKDKCGFETEKSEPHKTIHLAINKGQNNSWNLIWESYEGFEVASYNIYRGLTTDSLKLLHKSAGSVNQYTDFNAPGGYVYYQVEVIPPELRDKIKSITNLMNEKSIDLKTAKSNIVSNIEKSKSQEIYCYPNPANDYLYIQLSESKTVKISIFNYFGQILYSLDTKNQLIKINLTDFNSNIYIIKIITDDLLTTKKIFLSKISEY